MKIPKKKRAMKKLLKRYINMENIYNNIMDKNIEYRAVDVTLSAGDSRKISGYGIVANSRSVLLGGSFYETIAPEAINQDFIDSQDIRILYNHNQDGFTYARRRKGSGSLTLRTDDNGLYFEFEAPRSAIGDHILEECRRGDISQCSFGFVVGKDEVTRNSDGTLERVIRSFAYLSEISLCSVPVAYESTSAECRSIEKIKIDLEKRAAEEPKKDDEEEPTEPVVEPTPEEPKPEPEEEPKKDDEERSTEEPNDEETEPEDEPKKDDEEEEKPSEDELRAYYANLRAELR